MIITNHARQYWCLLRSSGCFGQRCKNWVILENNSGKCKFNNLVLKNNYFEKAN